MNVARSEMSLAINALLDNFPRMRVDPDAPTPELLGTLEQRAMTAVPVRLD
jgi:cytochrome P450